MTPETAYIGLGANLGEREAMLREAVRRLESLGRVTAVSSLYETAPVGFLDQPMFLNAVVALETTLEPGPMVQRLLEIEKALGRTRTFRNAPRTLDLDLLLLGDLVLGTPNVTLPHPRLHDRAFVLAPLAEIAPAAMHPRLQQTAADLLAALPGNTDVQRYAAPDWATPPEEGGGMTPGC